MVRVIRCGEYLFCRFRCRNKLLDLRPRGGKESRRAQIPFLFKQASSKKSEWEINALGLYVAEGEGSKVDADTVDLVRQFPRTPLPLLPHDVGKRRRYTDKEWHRYREAWPIEFDTLNRS
jgi:hypothetical protein